MERLRAELGTDDVAYVTADRRAVLVGGHAPQEIRPRTIIRVGGQYLVERVDEPDNWFMGELRGDTILCWGRYGSLESALRSL